MDRILFVIALFFFVGCKSKTEKRRIGNRIVEAIFINDSIADGIVKYYTLDGEITNTAEIKNGKNNGTAIYFYPNGKIYDSIYFVNDLANGAHYRFDTNGNLAYQDNYIEGKKVGDKFSYDSGRLVRYEFVDSNNTLLYSADYDLKRLAKWKFKAIININSQDVVVNGIRKKHVQFYWLNPPQVSIKYSLGIADTLQNVDKVLTEFTRSGIIKDTLLPILSSSYCYYISAVYTDSNNKFNKVYIQEF